MIITVTKLENLPTCQHRSFRRRHLLIIKLTKLH